jgi:hypothetical protein
MGRARPTIVAATACAVFAGFLPNAGAGLKGTARASVAGNRIEVKSKPFFPLMLIDQCSSDAAVRARHLGINLILNESCPGVSALRQLTDIGRGSLAALPIAARGVRGPALAGWAFPDEPEGNGWTPASLRQAHAYPRGGADGLLSFLTTGPGFFRSPYTPTNVAPALYGQFAHLADVAGFDLYPLAHCSTDLGAVYDAQLAFNRLAGAMPTFQWIETGPSRPGYCGGYHMTPAELRAEVWLAVAGGARGIGYFTHTWSPAHKELDVRTPLQHELIKTNSLLSALRPALVGDTVASSVDSTSIKVIARKAGRSTFVIAVNASRSTLDAQFHVRALRDGPLRVFGEQRSVSSSTGYVSDTFRPLAVHVYVQTS